MVSFRLPVRSSAFIALLVYGGALWAQSPVISEISNSAGAEIYAIAPQMLITIIGRDLAAATAIGFIAPASRG